MQNAQIEKRNKLSSVWVIPVIALLVSVWLITQHYLNRGSEIEIRFASAEGVEAGKTLIKTLNVEVGVVTRVEINDDLSTVTVYARIKPEASDLLRQDSKFWVVKPRIGSKGVSGLTTILSGAYIELEPGSDYPGKSSFIGLDNPPLSRNNKEGLSLYLLSDKPYSLSEGDPVFYKGFEVGRISQMKVLNSKHIRSNIFIDSPYDQLISRNTRFFNASGVNMRLNSQGLDVLTESLETTLTGGVSFELPESMPVGEPVEDGAEFKLYANRLEAEKHPYEYSVDYLLLFDRSVRGLNIGEFVEYRGIKVGTVIDIGFKYLPENRFAQQAPPKVPVLIRLDPGRLLDDDSKAGQKKLKSVLNQHIDNGLRAALKTGSLVTGQAYIQLDFYQDKSTNKLIKTVGEYPSIPTRHDDLDSMLTDMSHIVARVNQLPIDQTVEKLNRLLTSAAETSEQSQQVIRQIEQLVNSLTGLLKDPNTKALPSKLISLTERLERIMDSISDPKEGLTTDIKKVMKKLISTLNSLQKVADTVESQPDALIFGAPKPQDVQPGAAK
ncbi:intermembrane transport protein PqiB [Gayadomonas joobiniege]|uniref:intermembrane transport protein PqiB n=1 Tax=Gayadomonas joobiniege TaxID=1234606 RepID=UPI00035C8920|nr:intermembrane transport protein PqiB [Gayadomonas joobiniege]